VCLDRRTENRCGGSRLATAPAVVPHIFREDRGGRRLGRRGSAVTTLTVLPGLRPSPGASARPCDLLGNRARPALVAVPAPARV